MNKYLLLGLFILFAYWIITSCFSLPTCLIKLFCGFPCPGCGMTRALQSLIKGDFKLAYFYNPLIFFAPIVIALIIYEKKVNINFSYLWGVLVIIALGIYVKRLIWVYPNPPLDYSEKNLINFLYSLFSCWVNH